MTYNDYKLDTVVERNDLVLNSKDEYLDSFDAQEEFETNYDPDVSDWDWAEDRLDQILDDIEESSESIDKVLDVLNWKYRDKEETITYKDVIETVKYCFDTCCNKHNGVCTMGTGGVQFEMNIITHTMNVSFRIFESIPE